MAILKAVEKLLVGLFVFTWDTSLFFLNLVLPKYKPDLVVPKGCPGHQGNWPPYVPPKEGDSRSACPMLNAMANHGILPHDGKNITFREMKTKIRQTFNFAPSFCFFVPKFSADFLHKSYFKDSFDLADLSLHNDEAIEHDASLTRQDTALQPDQGAPDLKLVEELLKEATGKYPDGSPRLTIPDLSRALSKRRVEARRTNKDYTESFFHNTFGAANSSTMLTIFGGNVHDLTAMLTEERFSENWQPRILDRFGLTMMKFNFTVIPVERGVDVKKYQKTDL
ncbi:uncharacterized protein PV09_06021 [Verruconis gallopava]|uniref:Heme haloperoxidase family profile domain-containing protein n=1 Tax=Verruconis gallopava TaxID=253628 RepID=A0A0D1XJU2_9PEZI|nr:uncharacterized protein PV09_06021 [Verruconis gallopava]KIW02566.1 hypothetical protein PV09_06021 [Verruconis gallopava]